MLFKTQGITYEAISGHPDIFFCQMEHELVIAPNLPQSNIRQLKKNGITFQFGEYPVGNCYPETARYNAVVSETHLIHHLELTDMVIKQRCSDKTQISVKQGYGRCNLIALGRDHFITSDQGIYKTLIKLRFQVLYVDPKEILLPGFSHGFFGGACGVFKDSVYLIGNLAYHRGGSEIRGFIQSSGYKITELYEGPLFDGGSLIFL